MHPPFFQWMHCWRWLVVVNLLVLIHFTSHSVRQSLLLGRLCHRRREHHSTTVHGTVQATPCNVAMPIHRSRSLLDTNSNAVTTCSSLSTPTWSCSRVLEATSCRSEGGPYFPQTSRVSGEKKVFSVSISQLQENAKCIGRCR